MKKLIFFSLIIISTVAFAQDEDSSPGDFGIGIGLDYGGLGARFAYAPAPKVAILMGIGYNLNGIGFNTGVAWRMVPGKRVCPILGMLYGYNGVIVIEGASQYNKTYYGPSMVGGLEFHSKNGETYFNVELLLPFRPQAFTDDWNAIKQSGTVQVKSNPLPLAFSIGYHLKF